MSVSVFVLVDRLDEGKPGSGGLMIAAGRWVVPLNEQLNCLITAVEFWKRVDKQSLSSMDFATVPLCVDLSRICDQKINILSLNTLLVHKYMNM